MTVMLDTDDVELFAPGEDDEHGWTTRGGSLLWTGRGALQLAAGTTGVTADGSGGRGPQRPRSVQEGQLFTPLSSPAADGQLARIRDRSWLLSSTRDVLDPTNTAGGLGCRVSSVQEVGSWPL